MSDEENQPTITLQWQEVTQHSMTVPEAEVLAFLRGRGWDPRDATDLREVAANSRELERFVQQRRDPKEVVEPDMRRFDELTYVGRDDDPLWEP